MRPRVEGTGTGFQLERTDLAAPAILRIARNRRNLRRSWDISRSRPPVPYLVTRPARVSPLKLPALGLNSRFEASQSGSAVGR